MTLKLTILTGAAGEPSGADVAMVAVPPGAYATVAGERTLLAGILREELARIAHRCAELVGERLHHAEWTLTSDPAELRVLGELHDCVRCRAGTDQAIAFLREHPGREVAAGHVLYV